jgi:hypothetical protein
MASAKEAAAVAVTVAAAVAVMVVAAAAVAAVAFGAAVAVAVAVVAAMAAAVVTVAAMAFRAAVAEGLLTSGVGARGRLLGFFVIRCAGRVARLMVLNKVHWQQIRYTFYFIVS